MEQPLSRASRSLGPASNPLRSRWDTTIEILAALGTLTVAGASFSASWHGLGLLAASVGIPAGQAWVLPISLDGLQLVASMVILTRQRGGRPARWAWSIVLLATVLSAAGNAIAAPRTPLAMTTWGVLPILLAAAWHLLTGLIEEVLGRTTDGTRDTSRNVSRDTEHVPARQHSGPQAGRTAPANKGPSAPRPASRKAPPPAVVPPDPTVDLARVVHETCDQLADAGHRDIGWRDVVEAAPVLADPQHGYARPDRSVMARIRSWERIRDIKAAA